MTVHEARTALFDVLSTHLPMHPTGEILRALDRYLDARDEHARAQRANPVDVLYLPPQHLAAILTDLLSPNSEADARKRLFKLLAQLSGIPLAGVQVRGRIEYAGGRFYARVGEDKGED